MEVDKEYSSYQQSRNVPQHRNTKNNWRSDELTLLFTNGGRRFVCLTWRIQSEISNNIDRHEQAFMVPSGWILTTLMILTEDVSAVIGWITMKYGTHIP